MVFIGRFPAKFVEEPERTPYLSKVGQTALKLFEPMGDEFLDLVAGGLHAILDLQKLRDVLQGESDGLRSADELKPAQRIGPV